MWWRGLVVWLGAAAIGSVAGSLLLNIVFGGGWSPTEVGFLIGISMVSVIFTLGGSALLILAFAKSARTGCSPLARTFLMIPFAAGVGGFLLLVLCGGSLEWLGIGALYGAVTALAWAALSTITGMNSSKL